MIALIPARAGSKRVPNKNTRELNGHPLLAYSIAAAQQSHRFDAIWVSTDSDTTAEIASQYGASVHLAGPPCHTDTCCDITWIRALLSSIDRPKDFAILRPTSPFRTAATIQRCYREFWVMADCGSSIRAVEPVRQNPYKMWTWGGAGMPIRPLLGGIGPEGVPLHSAPTQLAPPVWIQNSSLEMSYTANVEAGSISGNKIGPFFTEGMEGFSIDTEDDWAHAVALAKQHPEWLPVIA